MQNVIFHRSDDTTQNLLNNDCHYATFTL